MTRAELIEAIARAICCPDGCEVIKCKGQRFRMSEATAALAAIEAAGCAVVPREALTNAIEEAFPAGHEQGNDEATAYDWGCRPKQRYAEALRDAQDQARAMIAASPVEARDE